MRATISFNQSSIIINHHYGTHGGGVCPLKKLHSAPLGGKRARIVLLRERQNICLGEWATNTQAGRLVESGPASQEVEPRATHSYVRGNGFRFTTGKLQLELKEKSITRLTLKVRYGAHTVVSSALFASFITCFRNLVSSLIPKRSWILSTTLETPISFSSVPRSYSITCI